uniref:Uncharacterized protein n=1 Tax=Brassica campestris TaxID=3711 RepID=A0A3P5YMV4_BRACM|nr:unnamed protein product [Brassica rapa]
MSVSLVAKVPYQPVLPVRNRLVLLAVTDVIVFRRRCLCTERKSGTSSHLETANTK